MRLLREARVLAALSSTGFVPKVLGRSQGEEGVATLLERIPGESLARAWPKLDPGAREGCRDQILEILEKLWGQVDPGLPRDEEMNPPHVLPLSRSLDQVSRLETQASLPAELASALRSRLEELGEDFPEWSFDFPEATLGLVHGDPHFENWMVDPKGRVWLLDFEWSRRSVPEVDLEILLSFFFAPEDFASDPEVGLTAPDFAGFSGAVLGRFLGHHPQRTLARRLEFLHLSRTLSFVSDPSSRSRAQGRLASLLTTRGPPWLEELR